MAAKANVPKWVATDCTGNVIASLPTLAPGGPLRRTMGRYESQTFTLTITDKMDPSWDLATLEGAGALICYTGAPGSEVVEWGGIITRRKKGIGNTVTLAAATPECYLDGRYTGDYNTAGATRDDLLIVADLVGIAGEGDPAVDGSFGWPFVVKVIGTGTPRVRSYLDTDDKTLYSAIDELAHVDGGPQWATGWDWLHGPERIVPWVAVGGRIGTATTPGLAAPVAFSPRMMDDGTLDSDYAKGKGANLVTAVSSSISSGRPQAKVGVAQQRPVWEDRFTPSTSITDVTTLEGHAQAKVTTEAGGAQTLSFILDRKKAPRFGERWGLGDDIDVILDGPAFTTSIEMTGQCIGVELTADTIVPYLAADGGF